MNNSTAKASCHFVTLTKDQVGICGAELHPEKPFTEIDACNLIPNWHVLNEAEKESVRLAHNCEPIKRIFTPPSQSNPLFDWPYYLDANNNYSFSDSELEKDFSNASKASQVKHDIITSPYL